MNIGKEMLNIVPGRVSTEADARLSFDTKATIERAKSLIAKYEEVDINRQRILIKIASTWEGIRAAEQLEQENINCNLTLLFGFGQVAALAGCDRLTISPQLLAELNADSTNLPRCLSPESAHSELNKLRTIFAWI